MVFAVPASVFAGLIKIVDGMLRWTWEGARLTFTPILFSAMDVGLIVIYFDAIFRADLLGIVAELCALTIMLYATGVSIHTLRLWRSG